MSLLIVVRGCGGPQETASKGGAAAVIQEVHAAARGTSR